MSIEIELIAKQKEYIAYLEEEVAKFDEMLITHFDTIKVRDGVLSMQIAELQKRIDEHTKTNEILFKSMLIGIDFTDNIKDIPFSDGEKYYVTQV